MAILRYLVDDVDRLLPFYEALGFSLKQRWGNVVFILQREDLELWLSGPKSSAAEPMPDGSKPAPGGWNRMVLVVSDIEQEAGRVLSAGAMQRGEITGGPAGRQLLIEDPAGNPIELFEPKA